MSRSPLLTCYRPRCPRYALLLREMLKFTPQSHPDHALVTNALAAIEAVAHEVDAYLAVRRWLAAVV